MSDFLGAVLSPLDHVVSAPLVAWHEIVGLLMPEGGGWTWALAIVGMTATIRILMMPLYVRQTRVRRELRRLEPQIRALKETYGHDQQLLMQEQMKLLKAAGVRPFLSLLPVAMLGLILVALFRIIDASAKYAPADGSFRRGFVTGTEALSLSQAKVAGANLTDTFLNSSYAEPKVLAFALIVVICVMHVMAQRQEDALITPAGALAGPIEQKQTLLLPALLVAMAAAGLVLPLGVLIFWATSKVWTVGQQRVLRDGPDAPPHST